jgi:prephenate dehydrogenase
MNNQISIIGLGQIGTSIGLALEEYQDQLVRFGHDKHRETAKQAKSQGAVDNIPITLSGAVKDADLVIMAVPLNEMEETLELVSRDLKPGSLLVDTAPLKRPVLKWVEKYLPEHSEYVGLTPALGVDYLHEAESGIDTARADLFENCLMAVIGTSKSSTDAVNAASNLVGLVGAQPYFIDALENDGLMSMVHVLPRLMSAVLLRITQKAPGWRDARKIAGKPFAQVTLPILPDEAAASLSAELLHNIDNSERLIDDLIRELILVKDELGSADLEELSEKHLELQKARDLWWKDREESHWKGDGSAPIPRRNLVAQIFGIGGRRRDAGER